MMRLKKFSVPLFALLAIFAIPFSTAHAALTKVGSYYMAYNSTLDAFVTPIPTVTSDGGDVKFCISNGTTASQGTRKIYYLMEYDPGTTGSGTDDVIGSAYLYSGECYTFRVTKFVDGDNGKAEIYVKSKILDATATIYD
jgi:hypothetical protein